MIQITLNLNDRQVTDTVQPRTHLADFLREQLDLTGTHLRCEQGACGARTLLNAGQPARTRQCAWARQCAPSKALRATPSWRHYGKHFRRSTVCSAVSVRPVC